MELIHLATFLVALLSCFLSGLAGGGGSYITSPYWLLIGMSPAESGTTGNFMGIGLGASSLIALRKADHYPQNNRLTIVLTIVTVIASIIGALVLSHIDIKSFKSTLAIITILSIPLLFIDRRKITLSKRHRMIGIIALVILLIASSIIASSAFSVLIAVGLSQLFDQTILESTALRRLISLIQSVLIFVILATQGNLLLFHAVLAFLGGSIGSYLGTRFAIKRGEGFAKYALAVGAFVGAIALLW